MYISAVAIWVDVRLNFLYASVFNHNDQIKKVYFCIPFASASDLLLPGITEIFNMQLWLIVFHLFGHPVDIISIVALIECRNWAYVLPEPHCWLRN